MQIINNNTFVPFKGTKQVIKAAQKTAKTYSTAPREITPIDKYLFRGYTFSLNLKTRVTQEEINELFKFEGDEFFAQAYDFLAKKLGIPEKLKPSIVFQPQNEYSVMAYHPANNMITRNPDLKDKSKAFIFGGIRHELQHFKQNMDIMRHETLGKKAVDVYSDAVAQAEIKVIDDMAKNRSLDEMKELGFNDEVLDNYKYLKDLLKNNGTKTYDESLENIKNDLKNTFSAQWEQIRQAAVEEMGSLKEGTREAGRAEKFFNEFTQETSYWQENGDVHKGLYLGRTTEVEALIAEGLLKELAEGKNTGCLYKAAKDDFIESSKKVQKLIQGTDSLTQAEEKELKEIRETEQKEFSKYANIEEYLKAKAKYLFD